MFATIQGTQHLYGEPSKHSDLDFCDFPSPAVPQKYEPRHYPALSFPLHVLMVLLVPY